MLSRFLLPTLAFLLAVSGAFAQTASPEEGRGPVLTVLGKGSFEAKPDLARFLAVVSTEGRTLEAASNAHEQRATRASKVLQDLKASGIEIEKSSFEMAERRGFRPIPPIQPGPGQRHESVVEGYTATTTFSLKTSSVDSLDQLVSKVVKADIFEVQAIRFHVVQERAALNQARRAAILDAREQAQAYAEAADLELGDIVAVRDGEAQAIPEYGNLPVKKAAPIVQTVQIIPPAALEFTASVSVAWRVAARGSK